MTKRRKRGGKVRMVKESGRKACEKNEDRKKKRRMEKNI